MTCYYPDLGSAPDWSNQTFLEARPIRSTTRIWVVTRHQYGISALICQTSFRGKTTRRAVRCFLRPVFLGETLSCLMFASICGIYRGTSSIRTKVLGADNCGNGSSARNKSKEVKTVASLNTWCNAFFFHSCLLSPLLSTTWISFFLSNSSIILNILFEHSFYFSFGFSIQIPLWSQMLKLVTSIVEKDPVKVGHTPSQIKVKCFLLNL